MSDERDPRGRVEAIASGYREAQILFTAVRLDLFDRLADRRLTAEGLAEVLDADLRGTRILADALVALSLLDKEDGRYLNGEAARRCLMESAPESRLGILRHGARLYAKWGFLHEAVISGEPVPDDAVPESLRGDPETFAWAMRDVGRDSVRRLAETVDLSGVRRLLDLGGGPGAYAIELARSHPELVATVFDRPETAEVARREIRRAGLQERVDVRGGDAFEDDLGGPWDFVLLSNLLHIYSGYENRKLVSRCAASLAPGGRICLKDFFLEEGRTSPTGAAVFAVNMLVNTRRGDCHTVAEAVGWLEGSGLRLARVAELTAQSRLVIGEKEE